MLGLSYPDSEVFIRPEVNWVTTMFRDSNEYETQFSEQDERLEAINAPADDRDSPEPEFTVDDELAYNLDVGERDPAV